MTTDQIRTYIYIHFWGFTLEGYASFYNDLSFKTNSNSYCLSVSVDCCAGNKFVLYCKNLDWCLVYSSFDDTGGTSAIVGAILAGSSSDNDTWRSIGCRSSNRSLNILAMNIWMYPKSSDTFTTLVFHCFVRWLYFLVCLASLFLFVAVALLTW